MGPLNYPIHNSINRATKRAISIIKTRRHSHDIFSILDHGSPDPWGHHITNNRSQSTQQIPSGYTTIQSEMVMVYIISRFSCQFLMPVSYAILPTFFLFGSCFVFSHSDQCLSRPLPKLSTFSILCFETLLVVLRPIVKPNNLTLVDFDFSRK